MIFQPALVTAHLLFDVIQCEIEGDARFLSHRMALQHRPRAQVNRAVGAIARPFMREYDVAFRTPVEMLLDGRCKTFTNQFWQGFTDCDLFAGYADLHFFCRRL